MAILDNIFVRVQPVAGESAVTNVVTSSAFTGTGTPALLDETGLYFWRVAAGTLLKSAASYTMDASTGGVTICMRFRRRVNGTDDFMPLVGWLPSGGAVTNCPAITSQGASVYRGRLNSASQGITSTSSKALNVIHTLVWRFETSATANQDFGKLWFNQVGRVGTAPDVTSPGANATTTSFIEAFINCQTGAEFDLFDFMVWGAAKTEAECAWLADDVRSLIPAPSGGTTPIGFTGTIPNQTFTNGDAVNVDLSTYFSGTQTPFTFANTGTSLSGTGLSISSAGALTGTATTGSVTGVIVTGTDADTDTASSNAFNVTVNASATPVSFTGTVPTLSGTENAAITPLNLSTYFSGSLTPFTYSLQTGTLPTGLSLNSSAGVISGTPTVDFSGNITVRATDTGTNTADTNSFLVSIAAEAVPSFTLTDLASNANVPWASTSGITVDVYNPSTGALVVRKTGLTSSAGADVVVSDAALAIGTTYNVFITIGTAIGAVKATAA